MIISLENQFNLILYSILSGVLTGILFDIYRLIRGAERPNKIITFIEDILFWIFAGLLVFIFLLYSGYVYVGVYLYLYIALGLYLYLKFISIHFLKIQYKVIKSLFRSIRIIKNFILYPLELIIYKIVNKNK